MITLRKLEKIYRTDEVETVALENVNLTVERGEFLSVMGPSGCGKSTLLNIMGLLDLPTSGTVEIDGVDTSNMDDLRLAAFRNRKLGFVFQSFHLINSLNVLDNVELPLLYRHGVNARARREAAEAGGGRTREGRALAPDAPFPVAALGRTMPACGYCPGNHRQSGDYSGRRADR